MTRSEKASYYHDNKFNCAQSVLAAFSDLTGLSEEDSLAVAGGFGSGVNSGEICGAASGAVMAVGLIDKFITPGDTAKKSEVGKLTRSFIKAFRERFGFLTCRDLKNPEKGVNTCSELITGAVEILEELLHQNDLV